jgi:hypothetical protein
MACLAYENETNGFNLPPWEQSIEKKDPARDDPGETRKGHTYIWPDKRKY